MPVRTPNLDNSPAVGTGTAATIPLYAPSWLDVTLRTIADAVIVADRKGDVKFMNHQAEILTGWSAGDAAGKPLTAVFLVTPEDNPDGDPRAADDLLAEAAVDIAERATAYVLLGRDGLRRTIHCTTTPTRSRRGRMTGVVLCFRDVAEERRNKQTQALLAAIVADSDDAIVSITLGGRILSWNAGAERLFGYTAEEAIEQPIELIIPPDWRPQARETLARLRRGERVEHFEAQRVGKDGRRIDVSLTISPLHDAAGNVIGASKVARDVTERNRAAAALDASEEQRRAIFHQAAVGMGVASLDGRFLQVNERLATTLGYARQELEQLGVGEITHPDDRDETDQRMKLLAEGAIEDYTLEKRYLRKDGGSVWSLTTVSLLRGSGGQPPRFLGIVEDISAQKQAQQDLRESEERFRLLADNMSQFAWMADPNGWVFWYNKRWYDFTGTTLAEMQGWGWKKVHHPDHLERVLASWQRSCEAGETWDDTFPLRGRDGRYRWFLTRAVPIRDAEGRVVRWFGTNTDVTEQRYAEEALREAARRKDEFLAMLAHELRNPLAPIRSGLDVLAMDERTDRESLGLMQQQVEHVVRLVDDLLDVSRIMRGKIELRRDIVDLNGLVRRAANAVRGPVSANDLQFAVDLPEVPLWIDADAVRIVQVVENLLSNAIKYTEPGGRITIAAQRRGDRASVRVQDTGVGIEPDLLPQVFDLFTQASRSLDRSQGGLGIGLTLVRQLVEMHGGAVIAESEGPGRGSTFIMELPVVDPPDVQVASPAEKGADVPRRILVVDDNSSAAKIMCMLLAKLGNHQVEVACDGSEALEKVAQIKPDLLFLDIGLPGIDGYEVARRLRSDPTYGDMRIIALTGYGQASDRQRSREAGIDIHLVKPAGLADLEEVLRA